MGVGMPGKRWRGLALAIVVASLAVGLLPAAANAGVVVARSGQWGPTKTYPGLCRYYDAWGTITMTAVAPDVYARNRRRGVKEWRWVRWRAMAWDRFDRRWVGIHRWSSWQRAWDYRGGAAPFSNSQWFENLDASYPHSYLLYVRFHWWNQKRRVGSKLVKVSPYRFSFGGGWSGGYDACGTV